MFVIIRCALLFYVIIIRFFHILRMNCLSSSKNVVPFTISECTLFLFLSFSHCLCFSLRKYFPRSLLVCVCMFSYLFLSFSVYLFPRILFTRSSSLNIRRTSILPQFHMCVRTQTHGRARALTPHVSGEEIKYQFVNTYPYHIRYYLSFVCYTRVYPHDYLTYSFIPIFFSSFSVSSLERFEISQTYNSCEKASDSRSLASPIWNAYDICADMHTSWCYFK